MEEVLQLILQKLESLESGQTSLQQGQKNLENGQKNLEQRQGNLEQGQMSLVQGQKNLEVILNNLGTEMRSSFKHTEEKLDEHKRVFDIVADEIKGLKDDADFVNKK